MQIKRPLVWLLASYLAGILCYRISFFLTVILGVISFLLLFLFLVIKSHYKRYNIKPIYFLLLLPCLFLTGQYRMNQQAEPSVLDIVLLEPSDAELTGRLVNIEETENSTRLTLKECRLILKTSSKKELKENAQSKAYKELIYKPVKVHKVIVYISSTDTIRLGNVVTVTGKAEAFAKPTNPGQFNEYQYYKSQNYKFKMYGKTIKVLENSNSAFLESLYHIKTRYQKIYAKLLPERDASILNAMILGEKSMLDPQTKELYQVNGIAHILAISGLHITLIGLTLYKGLRKIGIPVIPTSVTCCIFLYSYGVLTNFSVSTNRAVVMFIIFMAAGAVGRTYDLLSAAALSGFVILVQAPMELFNAGFLLSFGAILGISILYPIAKNVIPQQFKLIDNFLVCVSIQIVTLPVVLYFFYEIPTYSIFVNMLILPLSSLVILLAVGAGTLGLFVLPLGTFLAGGIHYILNFYELICKAALYLPARTMTTGRPDWLFILLYYGVLTTFIILNQKKEKEASKRNLLLLCLLCIIFIKPFDKSLKVTLLDVGQGDGIVIITPNGTSFLIDGGSSDVKKLGKYRLLPYFKQKGIKEIDYAIVTHGDSDHISGLAELVEGMKSENPHTVKNSNRFLNDVKIKNLILPGLKEQEEKLIKLKEIAGEKGINVLYIEKGDIIRDGKVTLTCLHPTSDFIGSNASSTVLSLNYKEFDLLLTGDLEGQGEAAVTKELMAVTNQTSQFLGKIAVDYDVLKVAHHGSKNSTDNEFLSVVRPELSLISCGRGNRYGHPHPELLKRLEEIDSTTLISYESGAVTIETDGYRVEVSEYMSK